MYQISTDALGLRNMWARVNQSFGRAQSTRNQNTWSDKQNNPCESAGTGNLNADLPLKNQNICLPKIRLERPVESLIKTFNWFCTHEVKSNIIITWVQIQHQNGYSHMQKGKRPHLSSHSFHSTTQQLKVIASLICYRDMHIGKFLLPQISWYSFSLLLYVIFLPSVLFWMDWCRPCFLIVVCRITVGSRTVLAK